MLNQIFSITFNNSFNTEESYVLLKFKKNKNKKKQTNSRWRGKTEEWLSSLVLTDPSVDSFAKDISLSQLSL